MRARGAVWLAAFLAALSLWLAAAPVVVRSFGRGDVSAASLAAPADASPLRPRDLGPVLDFAPFGQAASAAPAALPEGVTAELSLLGITMSETQDRARAILSGGTVPVANYGVGDVIREGITLQAVHADHVTLRISGQDQRLAFVRRDPVMTESLTGLAEPEDDAFAETPEIAPADRPATEAFLGRYRADLLQDPAGLVQRLGLEPGARGYLVTEAADEILLEAGLQPGDMLGSVNGTPLGDPLRDAAMFDVVASVGHANLTVLRGDETILMTFPLP